MYFYFLESSSHLLLTALIFTGILAYADDIMLLCPTVDAMRRILHMCVKNTLEPTQWCLMLQNLRVKIKAEIIYPIY